MDTEKIVTQLAAALAAQQVALEQLVRAQFGPDISLAALDDARAMLERVRAALHKP